MDFSSLPEFDAEFAKLLKKYRSLKDDVEVLKWETEQKIEFIEMYYKEHDDAECDKKRITTHHR